MYLAACAKVAALRGSPSTDLTPAGAQLAAALQTGFKVPAPEDLDKVRSAPCRELRTCALLHARRNGRADTGSTSAVIIRQAAQHAECPLQHRPCRRMSRPWRRWRCRTPT